MNDCPVHGHDGPPDDGPEGPFADMISALVTMYLTIRDVDPADHGPDGVVVTVHAEHDSDHDIFLLKVGIGSAALSVMTAERDAASAARDGGA